MFDTISCCTYAHIITESFAADYICQAQAHYSCALRHRARYFDIVFFSLDDERLAAYYYHYPYIDFARRPSCSRRKFSRAFHSRRHFYLFLNIYFYRWAHIEASMRSFSYFSRAARAKSATRGACKPIASIVLSLRRASRRV